VTPINDSVMFEFIIAVVPNNIPDNSRPTNNDPANILIDKRFDSVTDWKNVENNSNPAIMHKNA